MLLPGCYHDGPSKLRRTAILQKLDKTDSLFLAEADYSNFDRFMAVDLIEDIVSWFTDLTAQKDFWSPAMLFLHHDASLVWPDYSSVSEGNGWLFKPGKLGLLSGVKATSDTGTLVNSVVNGEALARTYDWSEDQLYEYLIQYVDKPVGNAMEYYYVQSDDTQLISRKPADLYRHGNFFMTAVSKAGLKGSIELADRFLMRHIQGGTDRPVPARVWQNTLSNETPPESEIIFLAGLTSRTDGLLGQKTVDPFQTGFVQQVRPYEARFTKAVLESINRFLTSAYIKSDIAQQFLQVFILATRQILDAEDGRTAPSFTMNAGDSLKLNELRLYVTRILSEIQLKEQQKKSSNHTIEQWLYNLYKDRFMPSTALMIEQLKSKQSEIASIFTSFQTKEEAFFKYATNALGVKSLDSHQFTLF